MIVPGKMSQNAAVSVVPGPKLAGTYSRSCAKPLIATLPLPVLRFDLEDLDRNLCRLGEVLFENAR